MRYILLNILILVALESSAQKMPDMGLNRIRINEPDRQILAEINPVDKNIITDNLKTYYWYSSNAIHHTQGGFQGRLLDGQFTEFYLSNELRQSGSFKKGLKDAEWKEWDSSGKLRNVTTWKDGIKSGDFSKYDTTGRVIQRGRYQNGLLQGTLRNYWGSDSVEVLQYQKGILHSKKPFFKRLNIFKKGTPADTVIINRKNYKTNNSAERLNEQQ